MADIEGLLGNLFPGYDPAALYGGALTDPATRQQMAQRGLLSMAGSFADSAMPTRMPTPFGAVLGHAAAALGASGDEVMTARLRNAQAQQAMANVGYLNQLGPAYLSIIEEAKRAAAQQGAAPGIPGAPGTTIPGIITPGAAPGATGAPGVQPGGAGGSVPAPLFNTMLQLESGGSMDTSKVGSYGEIGPSQITPDTWKEYARPNEDIRNPQDNLNVGNRVMQDLWEKSGGDPAATLVGYNRGPGAMRKFQAAGNNLDALSGTSMMPTAAYQKAILAAGGSRAPAVAALPPKVAALPPAGLLNVPNATEQMNAPIPGVPGGAAPGPAAPAVAGAPGPAAAAMPPGGAGPYLAALAQQRSAAPGAPGPGLSQLPPGLVQMADASGQVPLPAAAAGPNLVPGGAVARPVGPPQSLVPPPPPQAPVPPPAMPPPPAPPPAAPGPAVAPPMPVLPPIPSTMPAMPGIGAVAPTPLQLMAQGVAGLSALTGHPAPDFIQKLAGQPLEMQMEAYKAYVGAQANQMTARYQKELDATADRYIENERAQGRLPAEKEKLTLEQDLKLRNDMLTQHGMVPGADGHWQIDPTWLASKAQEAGATAGAQAAAKPIELDPTKTVLFPPGTPAAQQWVDAQTKGQKLPDNVQILANGGVQVGATTPTTGQIDKTQEDFFKLKEAAQGARQGIYETQQLREQLHAIGMSGPATEVYSRLAAHVQSLGILTPEQVKKYIGVSPENAEVAEKLSQDLLGQVLKTTFPTRITNVDIAAWKDTVPRGTMLQGAYDLLIDKILMPKFEHEVGRYGSVAGLAASGDPQLRTYSGTLENYDKAHPLSSYAHQYAYGPNGHRLRLEKDAQGNSTWVDDVKNPVQP